VTSRGQVKLKKLIKMLDTCAPGYSMEAKKHHSWVSYRGRTFRSLPLGQHGKRKPGAVEIEIGHIKQLIRHLAIDPECARKNLAQLR